MQIRNILTFLFILSSLGIFANVDSTGVQNNKGKKLIIHKVEAKETYFSLGRKYGVDPKIIMDFNNNVALQIGTVLNIPTERPFVEGETPQNGLSATQKKSVPTAPVTPTFLRHKVKANETLSEIAEDYHTSVKAIQRLNNMKGTTIRVGQTIKVRQTNATPAPSRAEAIAAIATGEEDASEIKTEIAPKADLSRYGLKEHTEQGFATWIDDSNVDGTKLLVLHRTAPEGTVIKVTNPATGKSTFAKVVGRFTENESTKDTIIVLTKAVADLVGASDKRFQVSIDYGLNE